MFDEYPSGRTIENTNAGKLKDHLVIRKVEDLLDIDHLNETKYVKAHIDM